MKIKLKKKKKNTDIKGTTVSGLKLPAVPRPDFLDGFVFPEDITELDPKQVSDLLSKYTLLYSYANQHVSKLSVKEIQLQTMESMRKNHIFRSRPYLNAQERWRRDSIIEEDRKIEEFRRRRSYLSQEKMLVQAYLDNYERYINALSRELSRKQFDHDRSFQSHLRGK